MEAVFKDVAASEVDVSSPPGYSDATAADRGRFDMREALKHRGHLGSVNYCDKERMYHGTMQNVRALVLYDAKDLDGLQSAFEEAVDHYIDFCESEGWDPRVGMPVG